MTVVVGQCSGWRSALCEGCTGGVNTHQGGNPKSAVMASISPSGVSSGQCEKVSTVSQSCLNRRRGWHIILWTLDYQKADTE